VTANASITGSRVPSALRALGAGFCAGAMLGVSRAPLGIDAVGLPALDGGTVAVFRCVPWVLLAGLLGRPARAFARGVPVAPLAGGAALGFAFQTLIVGALEVPGPRLGIGLCALAYAAGIWLCVRGNAPDGTRDPEGTRPADAERVGIGQWIGLLAAGAGVALAWCPLGYHLEHLSLGSDAESALRGTVLACLVAVGVVAFGPLCPGRARPAGSPAGLAALLALAAAAAFIGVQLLGDLQEPRPLDAYLRRFGLDFSHVGMLKTTALLTSLIFVAPALLAGTALSMARERVRLSAVLLGVGIGLGLWPITVDLALGEASAAPAMFARDAPPWTWARVAFGTRLAAVGAAVALAVLWRARRESARRVGFAAGLAAVLFATASPWLAPRRPIWILSPWYRVPVEPDLAWNTGDGLLTVERDRDGARFVTLDRRRMTPLAREEEQDALRFDVAWRLLPPDVRARDAVRVLLVGQMTPARAFHLSRYANASVDHTVAWHAHRAAVDALLFRDAGDMPGHAVAPDEARVRLLKKSYDLVLVPPSHGPLMLTRSAVVVPWAPAPAPVTTGLGAPEGTLVVAWLAASAPIAGRRLTERVVLSSRGVDDVELGLVVGAIDARAGVPLTGEADEPPWFLAAGPRRIRPGALHDLVLRPERRHERAAAATLARLAAANASPPGAAGELTHGLALLAAAQGPSSPYETLAQQTEIDDDGIAALARAAQAGLDPFQRELWEGLADVLVGKRMPDKVLRDLLPLAERYRPWPRLERAVAAAYAEFNMPAETAAWLARALASEPYDLGLLVEVAEWTGRAGDGPGEVALLRRALGLQPGRADLERLLTLALLRAGDPAGRARAEAALAADPDDEELRELLAPGPHERPAPVPPGTPGMHAEHP
jgi:hypothetical protein